MTIRDIVSLESLNKAKEFTEQIKDGTIKNRHATIYKENINFQEYLEYMTRQEMVRAAGNGQHALKDITTEKNTTVQPNPDFLKARQSFLKDWITKRAAGEVLFNQMPGTADARICLLKNGDFYAVNKLVANHSYLVQTAFFDKRFPELMSKAYTLTQYWPWWEEAETLNYFLCLIFDGDYPDEINLSESYNDEETLEKLQNDKQIFNFYSQLIQKKFNKNFVIRGFGIERASFE